MIAVIDYDAGNLRSVEKALEALGERPVVSRDEKTILSADKVILPGVGSFGDAMGKLRQYGLTDVIRLVADRGGPILGICLGMQILFDRSEESEGIQGLGLLKGDIIRFPSGCGLKVPHMGWNSLKFHPDAKLFKGLEPEEYVYFIHSYYLKAKNEADVAASSVYGIDFHASVEHGSLFACQFHPEKSGAAGLKILKNFVELA